MESLKLFGIMGVVIVFIGGGFGITTGLVTFQKDGYSCFPHRGWRVDGTARWLSIGSMNLNYPIVRFGCAPDHRYDSSVYQIVNGQLEPR